MAEKSIPVPWTVSSLTAELKSALETRFTRIYVEAEISGFRLYPSGHAYFTLKDSLAQISAVMFAGALARCRVKDGLKDGAKVIVYGNVTVYAPRGNYQLNVLAAKLAGAGDLMQKYLDLKAKLESEGLFDKSRKRELPFMPRRIGIVTSEAGAVIHDMCGVLTRRFPMLEIRLFPCLVQGEAAPATIVAGIEYFNSAHLPWRADLVIIARGGGSFEDLFCFNDETLVRAIAASSIPIISAVGHETDYTLSDFAADARAGTPSIAAEIAVPVAALLTERLEKLDRQLVSVLRGKGEFFAQRIDQIGDALARALTYACSQAERRLERFGERLYPTLSLALTQAEKRMETVSPRMDTALKMRLQRDEAKLTNAAAKLEAYSPFGVLERGYSLTMAADGAIVKDASQLKTGDRLTTRFAIGSVDSVVVES